MKDGKSAINLKVKGGDRPGKGNIGLALVNDLEFSEGTIEVDLKGFGRNKACFLGVGFNVVDGETFESVYFRPYIFAKGQRSAIQYVSWPNNGWKELGARKPGVYESAVNPVPRPDGWFHARYEITKKKVKVFVDDAKKSSMVVDRIATREKGKVGLWVDSGDGFFSNLKITPAK
jgi:hypothetical protein